MASVGHPGNGQSREELRRAKEVIQASLTAHDFPAERTLVRLDGHSGNGAVVSDVSDVSSVTRGKDDTLIDRAEVQARLHLPADPSLSSPESGVCRALDDGPDQRLNENGPLVRVGVAPHPSPTKKKKKRQVGLTRHGVVSERFLTTHSSPERLHRL